MRQEVRAAPPAMRPRLDERQAVMVMAPDVHAELDRAARSAIVVTDRAWPSAALAHPFLAAPGIVFAWWDGRETLHGGAFATAGGAWAVLADKGGGKSTTLGFLAREGVRIVTDDLVVIDGGEILAGPRCVDLMPVVADALGLDDVRLDARATKVRLSLPPMPASIPLRGLVHLAWGDRTELVRIPAAERAARLVRHRSILREPRRPGGLLDLLRLPTYELRRKKSLAALPEALELLLALDG